MPVEESRLSLIILRYHQQSLNGHALIALKCDNIYIYRYDVPILHSFPSDLSCLSSNNNLKAVEY